MYVWGFAACVLIVMMIAWAIRRFDQLSDTPRTWDQLDAPRGQVILYDPGRRKTNSGR